MKLNFSIDGAKYYLREIELTDAGSFQAMYEKFRDAGQYYAYLWNFEKSSDGQTDCSCVGEKFVQWVLELRNASPRTAYRFAVCTENDAVIGYTVLLLDSNNTNDPRLNERCEIGYFISPEYQGRNIATKAISVMLDAFLQKLKLKSFWGCAHPGNAASLKVFEKLGMTFLKETTSSEDTRAPERLLFIKENI